MSRGASLDDAQPLGDHGEILRLHVPGSNSGFNGSRRMRSCCHSSSESCPLRLVYRLMV